ncbi:hypothetical protein [Galbibacter orientalis]
MVDDWIFIDNSGEPYQIIAEGGKDDVEVGNIKIWEKLKDRYNG